MRLRSYLPTVLILILLLGATGVATTALLAAAVERTRGEFDDRVTAVDALLSEAMRSYQQALRAGVGMVNAIPNITRDQWRIFVRDLAIENVYPGIRGIGYATRLRRDEIESFVAEQRRDGRPDFRFNPDGERELYTAIVFLEPDDWRNRRAVGYDMFSEPIRRAAMEEARDTGQPVLSRKVTLMQETGEDVQPGTLVYMPAYAGGVTPETIEGRRAALVGYVYGALRMKDFLLGVLSRNLPDVFQNLRISIYDGRDVAEESLLFDDRMLTPDLQSQRPAHASRFTDSRMINVAGRDWIIEVGSRPLLEERVDRTLAWVTLFGGGLISFLIAGIFASLAYAGDRFAQAEQRLSAEVTERKRAQEEAQLANRELIHRVKNMLTIVTAIASQTARYSPTVADFNSSFRERLTALGRVHDLLRPDPTHAPDFGSFVQEILRPYCGEHSSALMIEGPPVPISRNEAVLLSLLINELGTNATKYGAWSVPEGKVALKWQYAENGGRREVEIIWQENGGPPVRAPTTTGFGTNVMKFSIERGLRGRITTSFDEKGVRHEIYLPRDGDEEDGVALDAEE